MMQFTRENAAKVMAGEKTMTRRVVKRDEYLAMQPDGSVTVFYNRKSKSIMMSIKWQVGRTYAVQPGRGKPAIGRIKLLAIRREKLQDISLEDICAELGVDVLWVKNHKLLRVTFIELWDGINPRGKRWADNPDVWVLTFEVAR